MHPFKFLTILLFVSLSAKGQDGTIKVQRNPEGVKSLMWCGGVFQRSWLTLELRSLQPIYIPQEVFYIPKKYSVNDFLMQNGFGAHIIICSHNSQIYYGDHGALGFSLVTGIDHFKGKEGDSMIININADQYKYKYSYNLIPINLRFGASLISKPNFYLTLVLNVGEDLLFTHFTWPPGSFKKTNWVNEFGAGLGSHFYLKHRLPIGVLLKTDNIDQNWFREIDLIFPIFYGQYKR